MPVSTVSDLSDEEILQALEDGGSNVGAATILGVSEQAIRRARKTRGLDGVVPPPNGQGARKSAYERPSITFKGEDEATIVTEALPTLGDMDEMISSRGLDPADWIITNVKMNEWNAMTAVKPKGHPAAGENDIVTMHQLTISMKRRLSYILLAPATYHPPLARTGTQARGDAEHVFIEYDQHIPFHDERLHEAKLAMLAQITPHAQFYGGDLLDFSTISRHGDHRSTNGITPQICIDGGNRYIRDDCEASPFTQRKKLKGNHDYRLESEQLSRSERIYDLCPAGEGVSALDLRRLLKFEPFGPLPVELVTDDRGWEHAEIEIVPGREGLVMRHGWLTGTNTADRSMKRRGRSMIVGHAHHRETVFWWDPSMEVERMGAVSGCQCLVRDVRHPHYAVLDKWNQGPIMVTRWQDGTFNIEHMPWDGNTLRWRSERWTA